MRQEDRERNPQSYLRTVDDVERMTGLDFFTELDEETEERLEAEHYEALWGD